MVAGASRADAGVAWPAGGLRCRMPSVERKCHMADRPPPVVLAIVICDLIIRDELTKKLTKTKMLEEKHLMRKT